MIECGRTQDEERVHDLQDLEGNGLNLRHPINIHLCMVVLGTGRLNKYLGLRNVTVPRLFFLHMNDSHWSCGVAVLGCLQHLLSFRQNRRVHH